MLFLFYHIHNSTFSFEKPSNLLLHAVRHLVRAPRGVVDSVVGVALFAIRRSRCAYGVSLPASDLIRLERYVLYLI